MPLMMHCKGLMSDRRTHTVGIHGWPLLKRTDPRFRQVAHLAQTLHQNQYFIASGGGPGAMEAANLGAYMGQYSAQELDEALSKLPNRPPHTAMQVGLKQHSK